MNSISDVLEAFPVVGDRPKMLEFLREHHSKRRKYITDIELVVWWALTRASLDPVESDYLKGRGLDTEMALYSHLTGKPSVCPHGERPAFKGCVIGFTGCGRGCVCAKEKMQATNMERYGGVAPLASLEVKQRAQATNMERHGGTNVMASRAVRDRVKATHMERYGYESVGGNALFRDRARSTIQRQYHVDHPMHAEEIRNRVKQTNRERHGVDFQISSEATKKKIKQTVEGRTPEHKESISQKLRLVNDRTDEEKLAIGEKRKATNRERHGVDELLSSGEFRERIARTNMERYGAPTPLESEEIRKVIMATNREKYGDKGPTRQHYSDETFAILTTKEVFEEALANNSIMELADRLGVNYTTVCNYCRVHGIDIPRSSYERVISEFLTGHQFIANTRKVIAPLELDFYLPQHNLAIEFNGLYWHSTDFKSPNYHREKYEACRDAGIRLLMINEDEWGEPVRNKILNVLGYSPRGPGARKLNIRKLKAKTAQEFFAKHHIQGRTGSLISAYGAYDEDTLVACVGYNRQRTTQAVELIRYATDGGVYAGVFSRLFRHSTTQEGYTEVISFADLRYSRGDLYRTNGFAEVGEIPPDYRYVTGGKTVHKSSFTKARIAAQYGITGSEREAMEQLGIPRIYDCGKIKFRWRL